MFYITNDTKEINLNPDDFDNKYIVLAGDATACMIYAQRIAKTFTKINQSVMVCSKMPVYFESTLFSYHMCNEPMPEYEVADFIIYIIGEYVEDKNTYTLFDVTPDYINELTSTDIVINNTLRSENIDSYSHMFTHDANGLTNSLVNLFSTDAAMIRELERELFSDDLSVLAMRRDQWRNKVDSEIEVKSGEPDDLYEELEGYMTLEELEVFLKEQEDSVNEDSPDS